MSAKSQLDSTRRSAIGRRSSVYQGLARRGVAWTLMIGLLVSVSSGCNALTAAGSKSMGAGALDIMSPSPSILSPFARRGSKYRMSDGSDVQLGYAADGSMTMETYQKIRQAKAQNAVVLQVTNDSEPVRVLPLPSGQNSAFVSELLTQTGLLKKMKTIEATVYRPTPDSIEGAKMVVHFTDEDTVDPTTDYCLRPGDRIQVAEASITPLQSLTNAVMRR
ncbi:hypothetical protein [Rhodopirellula sp. MGV]|uniref:hypothetical protein n=1 Tax=Rhodopirellula sp. MGV TaxID=2023130 RepID=UPI00117AF4E6|nr:hypothetical protein [Rhodopirellula sp. MGV]